MEGEVLRDDQWERLREFVPGGRKGKRGPRSDGRRFLDALLSLARPGGRGACARCPAKEAPIALLYTEIDSL